MPASSPTMMMLLAAALLFASSSAFQLQQRARCRQNVAPLHAWTLPNPTTNSFGFKSAWYDEYNPTARRTVYEDSPLDYTFVTLGGDWPSLDQQSSAAADRVQLDFTAQRNAANVRNPLRRLSNWAQKRRREGGRQMM